ncbi:MAG: hypothetical protein QXF52_04660 [Thermoproteota archaeon]
MDPIYGMQRSFQIILNHDEYPSLGRENIMKKPLGATLSFFLFLLFLALFSQTIYTFSEGSKWLSVGDFANYNVDLELHNATHFIRFFPNATATLRWEVIREMDGFVELAVSINATGKASVVLHDGKPFCRGESYIYYYSWLSVYKSIVLTVNVSSREAKYMGQDIGYMPFWIEKMPAKGQRIPMIKLENGDILYGEINMVADILPHIDVLNPDPNNFLYFFNSYEWYSGLALSFFEMGRHACDPLDQTYNPVTYNYTLANGTTIEVRRYGKTPLGKIFELGFCHFVLNSTSVRLGSPFEEKEPGLEIPVATVFFTASSIVVAYVFLRQRTRRIVEEAENAG